MNLFESLIAALKATVTVTTLVGTRIYPMRADEELTLPAIAVIPVNTARPQTFEGASAEWTPVRLTVHAASIASASAVRDALVAALDNYAGILGGAGGVPCVITVTSTWPTPDSDTGRHLYVVDLEIFNSL